MTSKSDTRVAPRRRGRPPGPPVDPLVRREEILDAAERVIARSGPQFSFAEIASEAGYARTAVYAAFGDQSALVHALAVRHTDRIILQANNILAEPRPVRELLRELIDLMCTFVENNPNLHPVLMQAMYSSDILVKGRPLFTHTADWATTVFDILLQQVDADPMLARPWACATVGAILLAAEDWNINPVSSRAEFIDRLTAFLWSSLSVVGADRIAGPIFPAEHGEIVRGLSADAKFSP